MTRHADPIHRLPRIASSVRRCLAPLAALVVLLALAGPAAAPALAEEAPSPWWGLSSGARPTSLSSAGGQIVVTAENLGDGPADGIAAPVRITDTLPAGLEAVVVKAIAGEVGLNNRGPVACTAKPIVCTWSSASLPSFEQIEVQIEVRVSRPRKAGKSTRRRSPAVARPRPSPPRTRSRSVNRKRSVLRNGRWSLKTSAARSIRRPARTRSSSPTH
jgi:hypothetical protein